MSNTSILRGTSSKNASVILSAGFEIAYSDLIQKFVNHHFLFFALEFYCRELLGRKGIDQPVRASNGTGLAGIRGVNNARALLSPVNFHISSFMSWPQMRP